MNLTKEQIEKIKTGVIIVLGILVFFGATYFISENVGDRSKDKEVVEKEEGNPLLEEGEVLKEEEQSDLTTVTMSDLRGFLENGDKKLVMLGTEGCYWCIQQKPILRSLVYKYNIEIGYLDLDLLTSDEDQELRSLHESLQAFGTPTFIIVDQGSVVEVSVGGMTTSEVTNLLKKYQIID